jgi:hypothetical protein
MAAWGRFAERIEQSTEQSIAKRTLNEVAPAGRRQIIRKVVMASPLVIGPPADVHVRVMPVGTLSPDHDKRLVGAHEVVLKGGEYSAAADCHTGQERNEPPHDASILAWDS